MSSEGQLKVCVRVVMWLPVKETAQWEELRDLYNLCIIDLSSIVH